MGKKDTVEKEYLNDTLHFADACNGILFQGETVIQPQDLEEADVELFCPGKASASTFSWDGVRYWKKEGIHLAVLALEYQSLTDYHMVFRNMMTESLAYYKQWKQNKRRYSKEYGKRFGRRHQLHGAKEFISGMAKDDRFTPVVLIVINLGLEKWEGATTLHEMLNLPDELKHYVNNYKLNIYDYHDQDDFSVFQSEVRVIFEALKAAKTESCMNALFPRLNQIEPETAQLLEQLLNITFSRKYTLIDDNGKEWVDVCKAWDDHFKSGEEAGIAIGIEQTLFKQVYKKAKKQYPPNQIAAELEEDIDIILPIYEEACIQLKTTAQ